MSIKRSFVIFLFSCFSLPLFASTYYIDSVTGDDSSGNGTSISPWKTISKGLSLAVSNDTLILKDGFYG